MAGLCVAMVSGAQTAQATTLVTSNQDAAGFSVTSNISRNSSNPQVTASRTITDRDASRPLSLEKFDASLGILEAVVFTGSVSATNLAGSASVFCRDSGLINSRCRDSSVSQTSSRSAQIDLPFDGTGPVTGNFSQSVSPSDFSAFIGTGRFSVPWQYSISHRATASCTPSLTTSIESCDVSASRIFDFTANVTVRYTYSLRPPEPAPVPLPASGLLLLGGLAALGLRRRAR
ncbi:MAG: choice-of-anchor E domain-containing protein [Pseudomonadota bacterium]